MVKAGPLLVFPASHSSGESETVALEISIAYSVSLHFNCYCRYPKQWIAASPVSCGSALDLEPVNLTHLGFLTQNAL